MLMANPRKKRRKRRAVAGARPRRRSRVRRRRNPAAIMAANPRRRIRRRAARRSGTVHRARYRRRRNPAGVADIRALGTKALYAIAGGIGTRALPQMILKDRNEGPMGYLANGIALIVSSYAAGTIGGRPARDAAVLGGAVMIAGRVVEDFLGRRLVEFGGTDLLGNYGDSRYDLGLGGEYFSSYFAVPTISNQQLVTASPVPSVAEVQATANMPGLGKFGGGRFGSRFAN